jgi:hypothetical protein
MLMLMLMLTQITLNKYCKYYFLILIFLITNFSQIGLANASQFRSGSSVVTYHGAAMPSSPVKNAGQVGGASSDNQKSIGTIGGMSSQGRTKSDLSTKSNIGNALSKSPTTTSVSGGASGTGAVGSLSSPAPALSGSSSISLGN